MTPVKMLIPILRPVRFHLNKLIKLVSESFSKPLVSKLQDKVRMAQSEEGKMWLEGVLQGNHTWGWQHSVGQYKRSKVLGRRRVGSSEKASRVSYKKPCLLSVFPSSLFPFSYSRVLPSKCRLVSGYPRRLHSRPDIS